MLIRKSWGVFAICSTQLTTGVEELDALVAQKYSSRVCDRFRFMEHDGFSTCFSFMEKGYLDYRLSFVSAKRMASLVDGFRRSQKQHSLLCTRATAQVLRTQSSTGRLSLSKMCEFVLGLAMPKPLDVRSVAFVIVVYPIVLC